jgi:hypothetical protein
LGGDVTTRGTLVSDVESWLDRALGGAEDAVIRYMEGMIARDVLLRSQETVTTLVATADTVALPADYLTPISVHRSDLTNPQIEIISPGLLRSSMYPNYSGPTDVVAFEGDVLLVAPPGTVSDPANLVLVYFARFAALVDPTDTNELLTNHYDLVFDAAMHAAGRRFRDIELADRSLLSYKQKIEELATHENMGRDGGPRAIWRQPAEGI